MALNVPIAEVLNAAGWNVGAQPSKTLTPEDEILNNLLSDFRLLPVDEKRKALELIGIIARDIRERLHRSPGAPAKNSIQTEPGKPDAKVVKE